MRHDIVQVVDAPPKKFGDGHVKVALAHDSFQLLQVLHGFLRRIADFVLLHQPEPDFRHLRPLIQRLPAGKDGHPLIRRKIRAGVNRQHRHAPGVFMQVQPVLALEGRFAIIMEARRPQSAGLARNVKAAGAVIRVAIGIARDHAIVESALLAAQLLRVLFDLLAQLLQRIRRAIIRDFQPIAVCEQCAADSRHVLFAADGDDPCPMQFLHC